MNYEDYHTHPINKIIHVICIPLIVLTTCNLLSKIKVLFCSVKLELSEILMFLMLGYYLYHSFLTFLVMLFYFFTILTAAYIWRLNKNYMYQSLCVFIFAWVMQFVGHAIEGNRPALFDSLIQTFTQAPVFSLSYILPFRIH